jgi:L-ascorbate metabolism protein UlaG (beta-lactamase superfamily)
MVITYFGKQFFKLQQGEMVLAFNPVSKSSKSGVSAKFGADIALVTTNHADYNGAEQLSHGERSPFVIQGPGEYEVKEIFVRGVMTNSELGGKKYINTVYSLAVDNINIAFIGAIGEGEIPKEVREVIDGPDILFVPATKGAAKLASSLEPKMVIPMDYDDATLKAFLKEIGEEKPEVVDKLTLKRKDLDGKEGEVVVLKTT